MTEEERPPAALADRLGFRLDLGAVALREAVGSPPDPEAIAAARTRLPAVRAGADVVHALCSAAMALGIDSIRAPLIAVRVARAAAALGGSCEVSHADAELAARLVLGPRATAIPSASPHEADTAPPVPDDAEAEPIESDADPAPAPDAASIPERVLAAATATIPAGLLARLGAGARSRSRPRESGKAGARHISARRGRSIGVRTGDPRAGARLSVIETLRAAAPWQRIRRAQADASSASDPRSARIQVRRDDFRVHRFEQHREATAIVAVDASGSTALERLAEAKGAVELLLAECYVRRDRVALLAFRGRGSEILLPPTRSLVRAKRSLAALPGGGGTPLAAGIEAATALADDVVRRGGTPLVVFLTDGRANITRDGVGGRERAEADAYAAARLLRGAGVGTLLVDTSPRPQPAAERLAREMGAAYLPLPHADSAALCASVRDAVPAFGRGAVRVR